MKPDGGPAFPGKKYDDNGYGLAQIAENGNLIPVVLGSFPGMSLRDYFAAKAMEGIIIKTSRETISMLELDHNMNVEDLMSEKAYMFADAMLKARE